MIELAYSRGILRTIRKFNWCISRIELWARLIICCSFVIKVFGLFVRVRKECWFSLTPKCEWPIWINVLIDLIHSDIVDENRLYFNHPLGTWPLLIYFRSVFLQVVQLLRKKDDCLLFYDFRPTCFLSLLHTLFDLFLDRLIVKALKSKITFLRLNCNIFLESSHFNLNRSNVSVRNTQMEVRCPDEANKLNCFFTHFQNSFAILFAEESALKFVYLFTLLFKFYTRNKLVDLFNIDIRELRWKIGFISPVSPQPQFPFAWFFLLYYHRFINMRNLHGIINLVFLLLVVFLVEVWFQIN